MRRIFISDTERVISDRQLIHYVFSPARLREIYSTPSTLLNGRLGDLEGIEPVKLHSNQSVKEAAALVGGNAGCVICEAGIVTPWDLIMKPWDNNKLRIAE